MVHGDPFFLPDYCVYMISFNRTDMLDAPKPFSLGKKSFYLYLEAKSSFIIEYPGVPVCIILPSIILHRK